MRSSEVDWSGQMHYFVCKVAELQQMQKCGQFPPFKIKKNIDIRQSLFASKQKAQVSFPDTTLLNCFEHWINCMWEATWRDWIYVEWEKMRGEKKSPASKTIALERRVMKGSEIGPVCRNEVLWISTQSATMEGPLHSPRLVCGSTMTISGKYSICISKSAGLMVTGS